jgi:ribosomal protein L37E
MTGTDKEHLVAACGTYCGACPAYIAKHSEDEQIKIKLEKRFSSGPMKALKGIPPSNWMDGLLCDGCLSGGMLAGHCQNCAIRICAANKQNDSRCSDCEELPCYRITNLINMGHYLHRKEYLPNLEKIREMGVQKWIKYEEERWRCRRCGLPMSWYDAECAGCGEPRSERLFPLSKGKAGRCWRD